MWFRRQSGSEQNWSWLYYTLYNIVSTILERLYAKVCALKNNATDLKVPYYTVFHQYIIGLRYIQNVSLKCLARNTKRITHCSKHPIIPSVSKALILCLLL